MGVKAHTLPRTLRDSLRRAIVLSLYGFTTANGFFPSTTKREFEQGEAIVVNVQYVRSLETGLRCDYYSLPFCKPQGGVKEFTSSADLGTALSGDRTYNSPYNFTLNVNETLQEACINGSAGPLTKQQAQDVRDKIDKRYRVRQMLDGMPLVVPKNVQDENETNLDPGFELGARAADNHTYVIFNHLSFNVLVHRTRGESGSSGAAAGDDISSPIDWQALWHELKHLAFNRTRGEPGTSDAAAGDDISSSIDWRLLWYKLWYKLRHELKQVAALVRTPRAVADALRSRLAGAGRELPDISSNSAAAVHEAKPAWTIVSFEVTPCSIRRVRGEPLEDVPCRPWGSPGNPEPQVVAEGEDIVFTYDVTWQESDTVWGGRWGQHRWDMLAGRLFMAMAGIVYLIYECSPNDPLFREYLPKLPPGHVFRPPPAAPALAVCVGTGAHLLFAAAATLLRAAAESFMRGPSGSLTNTALHVYFSAAAVGGAASVAFLRGTQHTSAGAIAVCLKTAGFSGSALLALAGVNTLAAWNGSSMAAGPGTFSRLAALWLTVGVPSTLLGGAAALFAPPPVWPWANVAAPEYKTWRPFMHALAVYVYTFFPARYEAEYLMDAVWRGAPYMMPVATAASAVVVVGHVMHFSVMWSRMEVLMPDHCWWQSFHGAVGLTIPAALAVFAVYYRLVKLPDMFGVPLLVYATYMALAVAAAYFCFGTVSLAAALAYVHFAYLRPDAAGRSAPKVVEGAERLQQ